MVRLLLALAPLVMAADLPPRLDAIANESIAARANMGIQVIDLKTGKPLYSRNASRLFLPASNMKLFSSALALLKYGPDKTFATRVLLDGAGNLILEGSGDPSMSARSYPYRKGPNTLAPLHAIEELAEQVVSHGLTRVPGDIVGDDGDNGALGDQGRGSDSKRLHRHEARLDRNGSEGTARVAVLPSGKSKRSLQFEINSERSH